MHDFAVSNGLRRIEDPITVFLYHDLDSLASEFEAATGRKYENWFGQNFREGKTGPLSSKDFVAVNTSASRYQEYSQSERQSKLAKSIFETYRRGLTGIWENTPNDAVSREGPRWLQEGAAEYFAYHALEPSGSEACYTIRGPVISYPPRKTGLSLRDLETGEGYYSLRDPRRDVFLALESLANWAGPESIFAYYASLHTGITWQEAFRAAFGMTLGEFYQRFEEHRAAGFPKQDCPADPPLVEMPGLPDWIKFQIYSEVDQSFVEELVKGARLIYEFGKSLDIPEPTGQIIVHVDSDLERLALWDLRTRRLPDIDTARKYWEDGGASAAKGLIVIGVPPSGKQWESDRIVFVMVHELVHSAFQHGLNGRLTDPAGFEGRGGVAVPRWLIEGMADFLPASGPPELSRYFAKRRAGALLFIEDTEITLKDAEVWPSKGFKLLRLEGDELVKATAIKDCIYQCGYLATELLASYVGLSRLPDYYMHLEPWMGQGREHELPSPGWRLAFEKAYGMTIKEFYERFEEHRAAGFPELDIPR